MTEVFIGPGAYFVISDIFMTVLKEEDEVVIFEPAYPCYYDHIQYAGGKVHGVPLEYCEGKWIVNFEKLKQALNQKTKVLILNNA